MGDYTAFPWDFSIESGLNNVLQLFIDTGGSGLLIHLPKEQVVALPDPADPANNVSINGWLVDIANWDTSDVNPFGLTVQGYCIWIYTVLNASPGPAGSSGTQFNSWSYSFTNGILKLDFGGNNCEYIPKARLKMRFDQTFSGATFIWIDDVIADYTLCTTGTHTSPEVTMDEIQTLAVGV